MPSINVNVITLFIFRFRGTRRHPANLPGRVGAYATLDEGSKCNSSCSSCVKDRFVP